MLPRLVLRHAALLVLLTGPAFGQARPTPTLDNLLTALHDAPSEETAAALEAQVRTQWVEAASPALRLLLVRGLREIGEGQPNDAADSFDAALDLDPELIEAWRGRAQARARLGDMAGAVRDIQEVLRREPRSFAAFQDLSHMAEARSDWRGALAAHQKLLEIDPHSPGGQARLRDLKRRALGDDT
jgi:tetratricopeptide (TPR) repeat protein